LVTTIEAFLLAEMLGRSCKTLPKDWQVGNGVFLVLLPVSYAWTAGIRKAIDIRVEAK